jgi:hypothetical protein
MKAVCPELTSKLSSLQSNAPQVAVAWTQSPPRQSGGNSIGMVAEQIVVDSSDT